MFLPRNKNKKTLKPRLLVVLIAALILVPTGVVYADTCGGGLENPSVVTSINIGCDGKGNPIMDMMFAIIRFLSAGVGLVLIGSLVYAGIQYTMAKGDPQATAIALKRISSTVGALILFIFAWALLGYVIPGMVLN